MENSQWLQILTYVFAALVVVILFIKVRSYLRISKHLRWELYPLAGEKNRPWGGSYLEEPEWWTAQHQEKSFLGELKFMAQEVLYFKEYFHLNRGYWYFVYPLHIGVFLFLLFPVLLFVGALTIHEGMAVSAESASVWGKLIYYVTLIIGGTAVIFGTVGCALLLIRRRTNKNLRPYTKRKDYFTLLFVLAVFLTGVLSWTLVDHSFETAREYTLSLITFDTAESIESLIAAHVVLLLLLAAYIPFTNVLHFFAKWFTFHKVRWDDKPNLRGSILERSLASAHSQPISWSAPHILPISYWHEIAQKTTVDEEHAPRFQKGGSNEEK